MVQKGAQPFGRVVFSMALRPTELHENDVSGAGGRRPVQYWKPRRVGMVRQYGREPASFGLFPTRVGMVQAASEGHDRWWARFLCFGMWANSGRAEEGERVPHLRARLGDGIPTRPSGKR